jgi:biopolymer transport protein TolR
VTPPAAGTLQLLNLCPATAPPLVAGVPIARPESRAGALDQQAEPVQMAIDGNGVITIDDAPIAEAALPNKLAEIAAQPQPAEGRRIYLRADRTLDYGRVMRVMGELNRAGLNRVALVSVGSEQQ